LATLTAGEFRLSSSAAVYPNGLKIDESFHATSRRATLWLGSGWQIMQDVTANGTKDFTIYQMANGRGPIKISADATILYLGAGLMDVYFNGNASSTGPRISSDGSYMNLHASSDSFIDGNTIHFRTSGYT